MTRNTSLENRIWAKNGTRVDPDTDNAPGAELLSVETGNIDSQGPFSVHFNFQQYRMNALLNEVEQDGILEWSNKTSYGVGSFAKIGVLVYQSLAGNNKNNPPATSPTQWKSVPLGSLPTNYVLIGTSRVAVRAMEGLTGNQAIELIEEGYAGTFWVDGSDGSTQDDGVDVLVTTDGKRLKRTVPLAAIPVNGDLTLSMANNRRAHRVVAGAVITIADDLPPGFSADFKRVTADEVVFQAADTAAVIEAVGNGNAIANRYGWASVYVDADGIVSLFGDIDVVSV